MSGGEDEVLSEVYMLKRVEEKSPPWGTPNLDISLWEVDLLMVV